MVQVRTSRVNFVVNATGFTAIAIKEGETETIQVNLNVSGVQVIVYKRYNKILWNHRKKRLDNNSEY